MTAPGCEGNCPNPATFAARDSSLPGDRWVRVCDLHLDQLRDEYGSPENLEIRPFATPDRSAL